MQRSGVPPRWLWALGSFAVHGPQVLCWARGSSQRREKPPRAPAGETAGTRDSGRAQQERLCRLLKSGCFLENSLKPISKHALIIPRGPPRTTFYQFSLSEKKIKLWPSIRVHVSVGPSLRCFSHDSYPLLSYLSCFLRENSRSIIIIIIISFGCTTLHGDWTFTPLAKRPLLQASRTSDSAHGYRSHWPVLCAAFFAVTSNSNLKRRDSPPTALFDDCAEGCIWLRDFNHVLFSLCLDFFRSGCLPLSTSWEHQPEFFPQI